MANLNLNITIPDAYAKAILDDFCLYHGYQDEIEVDGVMVANKITKQQFAKSKVANFIKESVKAHRATAKAEEARLAVIELVDSMEIS